MKCRHGHTSCFDCDLEKADYHSSNRERETMGARGDEIDQLKQGLRDANRTITLQDLGIFACRTTKGTEPQEWQPRLCCEDPDDNLATIWDDDTWGLTSYPTKTEAMLAAWNFLVAAKIVKDSEEL